MFNNNLHLCLTLELRLKYKTVDREIKVQGTRKNL